MLPRPGSLSTQIRPPISSTSLAEMVSPSPVGEGEEAVALQIGAALAHVVHEGAQVETHGLQVIPGGVGVLAAGTQDAGLGGHLLQGLEDPIKKEPQQHRAESSRCHHAEPHDQGDAPALGFSLGYAFIDVALVGGQEALARVVDLLVAPLQVAQQQGPGFVDAALVVPGDHQLALRVVGLVGSGDLPEDFLLLGGVGALGGLFAPLLKTGLLGPQLLQPDTVAPAQDIVGGKPPLLGQGDLQLFCGLDAGQVLGDHVAHQASHLAGEEHGHRAAQHRQGDHPGDQRGDFGG